MAYIQAKLINKPMNIMAHPPIQHQSRQRRSGSISLALCSETEHPWKKLLLFHQSVERVPVS